MPDWLVEYQPQLWVSDLEDLLEVHYFGRFRWEEARQEWARGGQPEPCTESPRPRGGGSFNTVPISREAPRGAAPWEQNRVPATPRPRYIKP